MWFCSIKSHFVVIKILKKVKKYKFYLCSLTSENCCFYSLTEGPFSFDGSIYSFSIFLMNDSLYQCSIYRSNLMQLNSTWPYEVGCSARWYSFDWASMSTIKIISWHPYSPMLLLCQYFLSLMACVEITLHPSSSSKINALAFVQSEPWQCPHASVHFIAFLGQLHQAEQQS